jgi:hypothetical protein
MSNGNHSGRRARRRTLLFSMMLVAGFGVVVSPQGQLNVCGCANHPASLGTWDNTIDSTYPPGTITAVGSRQVPLPADGVMVFSDINLVAKPGEPVVITFIRNAANTPVTLLASGNVTIGAFVTLRVSGDAGVSADTNNLGRGGLGGPGGFRGGDGAYQLVNFASRGGAGLGPGGGTGGNDNYFNNGHGVAGTFLGAPDLLPLVGGSGGGGGASTSAGAGCAAGGGGGGGGAVLIAANGTITINGQLFADGGNMGAISSNHSCASGGGPASGGAVRLLATTIAGSGNIFARGGSNVFTGARAQSGAIRMEALNNTMAVSATDPLASRAAGPGPIVNPVTPTVAITAVAGQPVSAEPQGSYGGIDLVLPAPGDTDVALATSGVPAGTVVNVTVKPRVGGNPVTLPVTLVNCSPDAACLGNVTFNLAAGAYFIEARATFQTP